MTTFRKYLLISFAIAILNAVLLLVFFVPRFNHTDTQEYISTIKYFAKEPGGEIVIHRFLKPLPILIGAALTPILKAENTLIFQNLIFYFLSVWLIFLLVYRIYHNEKQAFYGTVLYIGAYPMLVFGLASLTDLPGWFFYLLSVLISLNFLAKPQLKTAFLSGLIAGFGMLFKENLVAAPIFFVSLIFIAANLSIKEKLKYIIIFGVSFILLPLINSFIIYKLYSYSYWHWYKFAWSLPQGNFFAYTPLRIIIEIGRVFLIGWIFVLWGTLKEFAIKNIERIKVLIAFIPSSLSFFLWAFPHNRMAFIAAPLLILISSLGILRNWKNQKVNILVEGGLLFLYLLVNYAAMEFFLRYGDLLRHILKI